MLLSDFDVRAWRKINYRSADSVLTAEFLHGLYQRHDPFLNPTRFCRTVVVFQPWTASGYAPQREWGLLAARFGARLLRKPESLGAELERVLSNTRPRSRALADELERLDFAELSDQELMDLALEMHHVPLGEIYEVNLVQVEHATDLALRYRLSQLVDVAGTSVDLLISELLRCSEATKAGEEEVAFVRQVVALKQAGSTDEAMETELQVALARYRTQGAAYGAAEPTERGFRNRFAQYLRLSDAELDERLSIAGNTGVGPGAAPRALAADPLVAFLTHFSRKTGIVRDRNKALLGRITRHRDRLFCAIASRRELPRESLRLYLLEELLRLLDVGIEVPDAELDQRRRCGLVLERRETASIGGGAATRLVAEPTRDDARLLRGLSASGGRMRGRVCVVHSAADLDKMQLGDVLVAPGTDFDLAALLLLAGAVITEEGGVLSHAAVVARERGIPCLIGVVGATSNLHDREQVEVDADLGTVTRAPLPAATPVRVVDPAFAPMTRRLRHPEDPHEVGNKAAGLIALAQLGERVPEPLHVIDVEACAALRDELAAGDDRRLRAVAEEITRLFGEGSINLRSSSPDEDASSGSAAGVFDSAIAVPSNPDDVSAALRRVLGSASGPAASAYHCRGDALPFAVLLGRYQRFDHQGASMSRSPWASDQVLVEHAETTPDETARRVERVHVPRRAADGAGAGIPHVWRSLLEVASATLRIEQRLGVAVEVEWGIAEGLCTILQARPITIPGLGPTELPGPADDRTVEQTLRRAH